MNQARPVRTRLGRAVLHLAVFSAVTNVLMLVMPFYLMQVYDRVLPSASVETLIYLSIIAVGALTFLGLFDIVRSSYAHHVANDLVRSKGGDVFLSVIDRDRGDRNDIAPLRDLHKVRGFIASKALLALFDLPFAPLFVVLLYFVHPLLCWITLAGVGVMALILAINLLLDRKCSRKASATSVLADLSAQSFGRHADSLHAMGMRENARQHWGQRFAESLTEVTASATVNNIFGGISRASRMILQLAILGVGGWLVLQGDMTGGMIFASSIISGRALQPIDQLIGGWRQIAEGVRSWQRLSDRPRPPAAMPIELPEPKGALRVENLLYGRPGAGVGSPAIIKRVNFQLDAGEALAIIGPSRAGKTTLARLIVGAIRPGSGIVRVDGADLETWNETQRKGLFGYLAQDVQLFPGTIAQNIARFDPNAADQDIVAAAQMAHAHEMIIAQPNGYQTEIAAVGPILSGGERQRIGLARAFFGQPAILVLDEPNAHLDADGEKAFVAALEEAKRRGTTVILITHRISIARHCDKALLLNDGAVQNFGPIGEVLQAMQPPSGTPVMQPTPLRPVPATNIPSRS
ncbi:type I secretion system permease/ATPase [Notoacmeibacter sp. MSK16QG-6]|uniref:type I secretion system permease/ATPase n=1 Tax=Notoacmeibacter sp. MSK16QG-6 TaxID=2957982 RepID=UPI00209EEAAC|nr:type I secretion system permease/ATPase [Notoacmeibacter sp. MSK16QG-6]MCP1201138.1 type I secretion system permease/ATPase [Notoacmeibacter sp. MSK16QG-6]